MFLFRAPSETRPKIKPAKNPIVSAKNAKKKYAGRLA